VGVGRSAAGHHHHRCRRLDVVYSLVKRQSYTPVASWSFDNTRLLVHRRRSVGRSFVGPVFFSVALVCLPSVRASEAVVCLFRLLKRGESVVCVWNTVGGRTSVYSTRWVCCPPNDCIRRRGETQAGTRLRCPICCCCLIVTSGTI